MSADFDNNHISLQLHFMIRVDTYLARQKKKGTLFSSERRDVNLVSMLIGKMAKTGDL